MPNGRASRRRPSGWALPRHRRERRFRPTVGWPDSWTRHAQRVCASTSSPSTTSRENTTSPRFAPTWNAFHRAYGRPIWVTEWGLVDPATWKDGRARYDLDEAACFFRSGAAMLDDLDFVERHAWFAAFDGGDGWHLNTHAVADDGSLTPVGQAFVDATSPRSGPSRTVSEPGLDGPVKAALWRRPPDTAP